MTPVRRFRSVDPEVPTGVAEFPEIVSVHHVRLPVSDVLRSRDWYIDTLGFQPLLVEEEEDRIVGVALRQGSGVVLGLHEDPARAAALRGFVAVALGVADLAAWSDFLVRRGLSDGTTSEGHLGWRLQLEDPDGILIELHTVGHPSADDT